MKLLSVPFLDALTATLAAHADEGGGPGLEYIFSAFSLKVTKASGAAEAAAAAAIAAEDAARTARRRRNESFSSALSGGAPQASPTRLGVRRRRAAACPRRRRTAAALRPSHCHCPWMEHCVGARVRILGTPPR
jgi:hypothetical protein